MEDSTICPIAHSPQTVIYVGEIMLHSWNFTNSTLNEHIVAEQSLNYH